MGRLIVFEGIDGSGKSTQYARLCTRLTEGGCDFRNITFPQYSEPSSALIRMYLGGDFGEDPEAVNAYAASSFFAVDRFASYSRVWREYFLGGGTIITDRYTTSNAIHQGCKLPEDERADFFTWLYDYEFRLLGLPRPDAVIYMHLPPDISAQRMRGREEATGSTADIHERDIAFLQKSAECGLMAAKHYGWHVIDCAPGNVQRSEEDIHNEVFKLWTSIQ